MRRAFTLVELLIVISVIAVLAGLMFPAFGLVMRLTKDVKCSNNLRQLGLAIGVWRQNNADVHPGRLRRDLFVGGDYLAPAEDKSLLCPMDPLFGSGTGSAQLNRLAAWDSYYDYNGQIVAPDRPISYLYETSETVMDATTAVHFYRCHPEYGRGPAGSPPSPVANPTWFAAKQEQLRFGNDGKPISESDMPILRCYFHRRWSNTAQDQIVRKVLNVTWALNVKWTSTYWEHEMNASLYPLP